MGGMGVVFVMRGKRRQSKNAHIKIHTHTKKKKYWQTSPFTRPRRLGSNQSLAEFEFRLEAPIWT